jgi:hypothetical protein
MMELALGGLGVRIEGSPRVLEAMQARFGVFVGEGRAPLRLRIEEREPFQPELELARTATLTLDGARLILGGPAGSGAFDLERREGFVRDATGLGAIDAILRAALSLTLPGDPDGGGLLLHGALVGDRAFVGDSGTGKSTVARELGGACDELVIARPHASGVTLFATPYWYGRPTEVAAAAIVCLERGAPSVGRLSGGEAARTLLRHAVRYVVHPSAERALLQLAAETCARVPVMRAVCPTGEAFLPFVRAVA